MSLSTAALRELVDLGLTAEQILRVAEANDVGGQAVRSAGAERQARYRARKAEGLQGDVTRDVTGDASHVTPLPLPPSPQTPQPPTPTPEKTTRARRGRAEKPYPEDFEAAWKAYPHTEGRSSKPETLARWLDLSESDRAALPAACDRYRREGREPKADCGAPAMERWLKRSLHQHWLAKAANDAAPSGPVDPAVQARRLRRFRDTGVWEPGWGPMPALSAQPDPPAVQGAAA